MNEIGRLAKEKFNGDFPLTIAYVMENLSVEDQRRLTSDLTPDQANMFVDYFDKVIKEKGLEKEFDKTLKEEFDLAVINLTKEEVQIMEVNPFKAKLGKDLLKFLALNLGIASLYMVTSNLGVGASELIKNVALGFSAFLTTSLSFDTIKDLLNYFKFKKLKKQYEKEKTSEEFDKINNLGRKL